MGQLLGDVWLAQGRAGGALNLTAWKDFPDVVDVYVYGKREARANRKMGHFVVHADTPDRALDRARAFRPRSRVDMEELLAHVAPRASRQHLRADSRAGRCGEGLPPAAPAKKGEAVRLWLQAVNTEPATSLSARLVQLDRFARSTTASTLWPLYEALARRARRPAHRDARHALPRGRPALALSPKLIRRLLDCVETHGDDGHFRALELGLDTNLLEANLAVRAVRVMQRGLAAKPQGPELTAAERKAFRARDWTVAPVTTPAVDPLVAVYEAPADLARRRVLADVLLERGDRAANSSRCSWRTRRRSGRPRWSTSSAAAGSVASPTSSTSPSTSPASPMASSARCRFTP